VADTVRIHLQGGPCDGQNATVTRKGDLLPGFTCKGTNYQPTAETTATGRVVYTTKISQQKPPAKTTEKHATEAWNRLAKAGLHDLPKAVQRSNENIRALKRLVRNN